MMLECQVQIAALSRPIEVGMAAASRRGAVAASAQSGANPPKQRWTCAALQEAFDFFACGIRWPSPGVICSRGGRDHFAGSMKTPEQPAQA